MKQEFYRWVLSSDRMPTLEDYKNTYGIIYKKSNGIIQVKQPRANFSVKGIIQGEVFYKWLEKVPESEISELINSKGLENPNLNTDEKNDPPLL